MAYNKTSEERKWNYWKEQEEKKLRELGMEEEKIQKLRQMDREDFLEERRYREHLDEMMQDMECRMETMHMGRMIHMLSHQLKRRNIQEELMDEGLTGSQRHIMKFILLRTLHTDVYQKDIEEEFRIRKSTVTGILKLLEKNGFIRRESVPQDARLKRIVPTARAESLRPQILEQLGRTEALLMEGIPEEELHIWRSVMCRMFGNLVKAEEEASKTNKNIKEEEEKDE
mgnify:FL=1